MKIEEIVYFSELKCQNKWLYIIKCCCSVEAVTTNQNKNELVDQLCDSLQNFGDTKSYKVTI